MRRNDVNIEWQTSETLFYMEMQEGLSSYRDELEIHFM